MSCFRRCCLEELYDLVHQRVEVIMCKTKTGEYEDRFEAPHTKPSLAQKQPTDSCENVEGAVARR